MQVSRFSNINHSISVNVYLNIDGLAVKHPALDVNGYRFDPIRGRNFSRH